MTALHPGHQTDRWRLAAIALAAGAALVAGYLGVVSLQLRGTPWGCGDGSGCASVLKSRWSNVAGMPVGFVAVAAYLLLATLVWSTRRPPSQPPARALLIVASMVLTAALYFALLQLVVIQSICPWCMADHVLGGAAAVAALVVARRHTPRTPARSPAAPMPTGPFADSTPSTAGPDMPGRRQSAVGGVATGVAVTLAFVVIQHFTARSPDVARIESTIRDDGDGLTLSLKNGDVQLPLSQLPRLGLAAAPRQLILLFDYCCPHCREAHRVVRRLQPLAQDEWQVVCVPTPLNAECNPAIEETEPRFRDACELARLSLAVWRLRPADWPAFDDWLFEPELPRTAAEARSQAAALYGEIEIAEALLDPALHGAIASSVTAYRASGGRVLPLILSPGVAGVAGRTDSDEELKQLLAKEFGFPAPPRP